MTPQPKERPETMDVSTTNDQGITADETGDDDDDDYDVDVATADQEENTDHYTRKMMPEIPLVRLDLMNITYAPVTNSTNKGESSRTTVLSNITTSISPYQLTAFSTSWISFFFM